jgi:hypothetical protein
VDNLRVAHNEMPFYTWTATECCLSKGETRATLEGDYPNLIAGDLLILSEVKDALPWPLCLASRGQDGDPITRVSVAYGNIGMVDAGRTIGPPMENNVLEDLPDVPEAGQYRPQLQSGPLTFATPLVPASTINSARALMRTDPRRALPQITLNSTFNNTNEEWFPRLHLLARDIASETAVFVAERPAQL